ncbi:MAG: aldo/keto reductase, partial [Ignavibacteria bacterium]|nr:aldo/keto reductase [Ignavibacteria bacterium]
ALYKALTNGINVIDTSSNYANGRSEELVGKIISDLITENKIKRENIFLITKGGYIQGQNYKFASDLKKEGKPFNEVVELSENLWHCISPDFLEDQINRQLHRLNQSYVDVYLLHNPEYYLNRAKDQNIDLTVARNIYYSRIKKAFEFLETKVSEGKILSYGASSNTFISHSNEYDFTSLEKVFEIANSISEKHNFKVVQFPFNLFEAGAITNKNQSDNTKTVLEFSSDNNLTVLINRPLNAITSKGLVRIADFKWDVFLEKDFIKQIKLVSLMEEDLLTQKIAGEISDEKDLNDFKKLLNFGKLVEENWKFFGSIEHYNDMLTQLFVPKISDIMLKIEDKITGEDTIDFSGRYLKECYKLLNFVGNYYKLRADKRSKFIHSLINKNLDERFHKNTLSQKSVMLLNSIDGVDCVLTGIRKESYVDDICEILNSEKILNAKEIIQFVSKEIEYSDT